MLEVDVGTDVRGEGLGEGDIRALINISFHCVTMDAIRRKQNCIGLLYVSTRYKGTISEIRFYYIVTTLHIR